MRVQQQVLDAIAAHARRDSPRECCGLLIGRGDCIAEAVATDNVAADPLRRYEISPVEYFAQIKRCRAVARHGGAPMAVVGAYHSHPRSAPEPSPTDLREAFEGFLYVIIGPVHEPDRVATRAYQLRDGNLQPVQLVPVAQEAVPVIQRALTAVLGIVLASGYAGTTHASPLAAQATPAQEPQPSGPLVQAVRVEGASLYTTEEIVTSHQLAPGTRLTRPVDEIATDIRTRYEKDGYTLATVDASLDDASGVLTIRIDEGQFDAIEVSGVPEAAGMRILEGLALHPGEVFNASQADRALDEALAFAQGAIQRVSPTFTLVPEAGRRVLRIALRTRSHESGAFFGTGREDWYSPVDALNVGAGFHNTIFDQTRFNHTFWSGYLTYKTGPERVGYSLGLERPFFADGMLQAGGAIHDLTASDDQWRLGGTEQSLVALTFRNTFRDYHRRKGYQLHAALRPFSEHELIVAWRDETHQALVNETDYGFFRDDHPFRANAPATPGDLRAVLIGYTFDSRGLAGQKAPERYRRHLLDDVFSEPTGRDHGVRLDWRSELAPASFEHDFDFNRHIATARAWWETSPRQLVSARLVTGGSSGSLPSQRVFALGGIGTVRGYRFKEALGTGMLLLNGELRQEFSRGKLAGLVFVDAGRVYRPRPGSTGEWMRGVGVGLELGGSSRIELGWRLDDIPRSLQVLFRLQPTF